MITLSSLFREVKNKRTRLFLGKECQAQLVDFEIDMINFTIDLKSDYEGIGLSLRDMEYLLEEFGEYALFDTARMTYIISIHEGTLTTDLEVM